MKTTILLLLALTFGFGCTAPVHNPDMGERDGSPFLPGLGDHQRKITTNSHDAQRWFDQGLVLLFAFNHDEAIRAFQQAAKLDPDCAMAWWGIALANGPHINNPALDPGHARAAWEALGKARAARNANETERALITALAARYAADSAPDRHPLDLAYADAMRGVWHAHPRDADIGALFAESLMDLRPWDLWTRDGKPQPGTPEIVETLDAVLALAPEHPGANHFMIHTLEASPHPERAQTSADRLRTLVPGAGHLLHMPAHIDARVGHWANAAIANERAIETDRRYRERSPEQGFYHVYMAHNRQFLAWVSMMEGKSALAIRSAREMVAGMPREFIEHNAPLVDGFLILPLEALMRFGKWEEILREPAPPVYLPQTACIRHFARGVAYAALGSVTEAEQERELFVNFCAAIPADAQLGLNPAKNVLELAQHALDGEIAVRRGDTLKAVHELELAAKIEDDLAYDEPPDWMVPARHALGAVLLQAKRYPEAEAVYRNDLEHNRENGWALWGLARALDQQGKHAESDIVRARFERAWARADITLDTSCLCVRGL